MTKDHEIIAKMALRLLHSKPAKEWIPLDDIVDYALANSDGLEATRGDIRHVLNSMYYSDTIDRHMEEAFRNGKRYRRAALYYRRLKD